MRPVTSNRDSTTPLKAPPSGMPLVILPRVLRAKSRALDAVRRVSGVMSEDFFGGVCCCPDFLSLSDRFVAGRVRDFRRPKIWRKRMALERARRKENRVGGDELWAWGAAKDSFLAGGTRERCYSFRLVRAVTFQSTVMDGTCCPDDGGLKLQAFWGVTVSVSFIPIHPVTESATLGAAGRPNLHVVIMR
jgi:hypothetical protein